MHQKEKLRIAHSSTSPFFFLHLFRSGTAELCSCHFRKFIECIYTCWLLVSFFLSFIRVPFSVFAGVDFFSLAFVSLPIFSHSLFYYHATSLFSYCVQYFVMPNSLSPHLTLLEEVPEFCMFLHTLQGVHSFHSRRLETFAVIEETNCLGADACGILHIRHSLWGHDRLGSSTYATAQFARIPPESCHCLVFG